MQDYIAKIERDGYCYIPQVFARDEIDEALALVRQWYAHTVERQSDRMPFLNKDQPMVYNLQAKELVFLRMLLHTDVLQDILLHFLNDRWFTAIPPGEPNYILRSFLARSSNDQMPMHIDSFVPYQGPYVFIMQCSIILEDQTEQNGCTVVVPGSHLAAEYATQDAFQNARPIESCAGDVVFWDSRLWHGTRANQSGGTRWAMIATFCRWWMKQAFDIPGNLPQDIYDQLTNREKAILGFCSVPYDNETYGIDMKRSYDLLPHQVADYRL